MKLPGKGELALRLAIGIAALYALLVIAPAAGQEVGQGQLRTDQLPAISPAARQYLHEALGLFRRMHIRRDQVSWTAIESGAFRHAASAQTARDTYPSINWIIAQLGERHTFLIEPLPPSPAVIPTEERPVAAPGPVFPVPTGTMLAGNIAMVSLPAYGGSTDAGGPYTDALKGLLRRFDARGACGWIIDLRNNMGGNVWPMINGLVPLLGRSPYGAFETYGQAGFSTIRLIEGRVGDEPSAQFPVETAPPPETDPPTAILLDDRTLSSAEMVAVLFRHRGNVAYVGIPSGGYLTVNTPQTLSDGAVLLMTTGWIRDRRGWRHSEPLKPDIVAERGQPTVDAAVAWLRNHPLCRGASARGR